MASSIAPEPASGRSRHRHRLRFALVALASVAVAAALALSPRIHSAEAQVQASSEWDGADCNVTVPGSWASSSLLPDPFTKINGSRITTQDEWECRRSEIKELAERTVYGDKPGAPTSVSGTVTSSRITVNVSANGRSTSFSATVQLPSGSGPFPAVIVYGGFGADTSTILGTGTAVINYDPGAVGAEGTGRGNKQGAFYTLYGATSTTGILMAQAWGVSRIIDVIEQSGGSVLNNSTGVTGCSRYGKGAFVAGAFDQRVDLTMPIESGTGGAPALRSIAQESGSQPLSSAYGEQPWLGDAFSAYTSNPAGLPVDTHEMVGMVAPRGLFIMENPHVEWLGARSGAVAALGGAEVYKALGAAGNISYHSNVSDGTHCATRSEWRTPLQQSINTFLKGSGNPPAVISMHPNKSANLSQWRNWTTPVLGAGEPEETTTPPEETTDPEETTSPPPGGSGCTARVEAVSTWNGGWQGNVHVTAGSAAISGWRLTWTWSGSQRITSSWNAAVTSSGASVTADDVGWNGAVASGETRSAWGFVASGSSTAPTVTCTVT
ncbi:cellulose binding domain-containing protein [Glycomyces harbinensis]|uniref:Cellulose binding domain-containing protein n=1 Tax=Glycomyces harbinensis TaxID=58114 RepID=A0A1G6ZYD7_9ACTN|nr:cellulose binding domain-containing protein [Glycomyces harbinensis]SDE07582.1 Cellulose binding domain-containing protein [Glycomyces harbinensis]